MRAVAWCVSLAIFSISTLLLCHCSHAAKQFGQQCSPHPKPELSHAASRRCSPSQLRRDAQQTLCLTGFP